MSDSDSESFHSANEDFSDTEVGDKEAILKSAKICDKSEVVSDEECDFSVVSPAIGDKVSGTINNKEMDLDGTKKPCRYQEAECARNTLKNNSESSAEVMASFKKEPSNSVIVSKVLSTEDGSGINSKKLTCKLIRSEVVKNISAVNQLEKSSSNERNVFAAVKEGLPNNEQCEFGNKQLSDETNDSKNTEENLINKHFDTNGNSKQLSRGFGHQKLEIAVDKCVNSSTAAKPTMSLKFEDNCENRGNDEVGDGWETWDDTEIFENVSQESGNNGNVQCLSDQNASKESAPDGKNVAEEFHAKSSWGWGGLSDVLSAVGEEISNVVETGLGLPPAEELARKKADNISNDELKSKSKNVETIDAEVNALGGFLSNIGSTFISGSLDVLETLGKATFDKLTIPKENSRGRRLIFEPQDNANFSDVLKELRERQLNFTGTSESSSNCSGNSDAKITATEATFIDLFEAYGGFVHLEGLEMLSANSYVSGGESSNLYTLIDETVNKHLAENSEQILPSEEFQKRLKRLLAKIGLPYDGLHLIDCERRCHQKSLEDYNDASHIFKTSLEALAEFTAHSVQALHKLGQLTVIAVLKAEERPFAEFLALIGTELTSLANAFVCKLNSFTDDGQKIGNMVTSVFLGAEDGFTYVQQSIRLLAPLISQNH
uniref:PH domain-containing protein n=1 Tax=Syphacia muris TaxID=451379 RepID=A0A0N5A984_9BILA